MMDHSCKIAFKSGKQFFFFFQSPCKPELSMELESLKKYQPRIIPVKFDEIPHKRCYIFKGHC